MHNQLIHLIVENSKKKCLRLCHNSCKNRKMLAEIRIEALLVDERPADRMSQSWNAAFITDSNPVGEAVLQAE
jgi:hypothetical protein